MATCPLCSAQVPDDFGLIECSSCKAQLIVHMDGRVEYSGGQEIPATSAGSEPADDSQFADAADLVDKTIATKEPAVETFAFGDPMVELDLPPEIPSEVEPTFGQQDLMKEAEFTEQERRYEAGETAIFSASPDSEGPPPLPDETQQLSEAPPPSAVDPFDIIPEEPAAEVYKPGNAKDSPDLSDIANFGNSDSSSARDGSLRYNLIITGIDTVDVRESFREAITDRKLVWDIDQILRSLKNGEVRIQNVPPPKAYILITRLRNLPLQVRWEQYAISQT